MRIVSHSNISPRLSPPIMKFNLITPFLSLVLVFSVLVSQILPQRQFRVILSCQMLSNNAALFSRCAYWCEFLPRRSDCKPNEFGCANLTLSHLADHQETCWDAERYLVALSTLPEDDVMAFWWTLIIAGACVGIASSMVDF